MKKLIVSIAFLSCLGVACGASFDGPVTKLDPQTNPCGAYPVECGGGDCCDENYVCGGTSEPSCPADKCCWNPPSPSGNDFAMPRRPKKHHGPLDGGASR